MANYFKENHETIEAIARATNNTEDNAVDVLYKAIEYNKIGNCNGAISEEVFAEGRAIDPKRLLVEYKAYRADYSPYNNHLNQYKDTDK